jgi:hypothetical protein
MNRRQLLGTVTGAGLGLATTREIGHAQVERRDRLNVWDFGARGVDAVADTTAIEAAFRAAGRGREVYFPGLERNGGPGWYGITRTLDRPQGVHLVGDSQCWSNLIWAGSGGGTLMRTYGNSQGGIKDMTIAGDPAILTGGGVRVDRWPRTLIDFGTQSLIDWANGAEDVQFGACTGDAIRIPGGWWNFWMHRVRWDGVGGYWINAVAAPGQNLSSLHIDTFTADMNPASPSKWGFRFDLTQTPAPSGPIRICCARIEATSGDLASDHATVTLVSNPSTGPQWQISLENLAIDKGAAVAGKYALVRHIGNANGGQFAVAWRDIRLGWVPTSPLVVGDLPNFGNLSIANSFDLREFTYGGDMMRHAGVNYEIDGTFRHSADPWGTSLFGVYGAQPVAQQVLPIGASTDAVIRVLQRVGLARQA